MPRQPNTRTENPTNSTPNSSRPLPHPTNPLQLPFLRELPSQHVQILHHIPARPDERLLWAQAAVRLHAELEVGEERVWDLVGGKDDIGGREEARAEEVGEGVVFFLEEEEGGVRDAWAWLVSVDVGGDC